MPPAPDVGPPEPPAAGVDAAGAVADDPDEAASPSTLTALPDAVTGADTPIGA